MTVTINGRRNGIKLDELMIRLEDEQNVLGSILYDNDRYWHLTEFLRSDHFYEPLHARLYSILASEIQKGRLAEPILISERIKEESAYEELGGIRYLADLIDRSGPLESTLQAARSVFDAAIRRGLVSISSDAIASAKSDRSQDGPQHVVRVQDALNDLLKAEHSVSGFISFSDALRDAVESAAEAYSIDIRPGLATGEPQLDVRLGGLQPSDLIILVSQPSSTLPLTAKIAFNVACASTLDSAADREGEKRPGGSVAYFSLESSAEQLARRILADAADIPADRLRRGDIDAAEFGRMRDLAIRMIDSPLYIDASSVASMTNVAARARRLARSVGLDLIVIDEIRGLSDSGEFVDEVELGGLIEELALLAREIKVPILGGSKFTDGFVSYSTGAAMLSRLRNCTSFPLGDETIAFAFINTPLEQRGDRTAALRKSIFRRVTVPEIQKAVASHFSFTVAELVADRRSKEVLRPRQIAMYLARALTDASLPDIAKHFERDHTAVLHAVRRIEQRIEDDSTMVDDITVIMSELADRVEVKA